MVSKMGRAVTKKPRLKLGVINCRLFAVTIEVPKKGFRRDAFLNALPIEGAAEVFNTLGQFHSVCNRKSKQVDYQAHVYIHKLVNGSKDSGVAVHVDLLPTKRGRNRGEKPPFAEEIFRWVHQFILDGASIKLFERCEFLFPTREYESVFSLPLRMSGTLNYTGHPIFENSEMIGLRIMLASNQVGLISVMQQVVKEKGIVVSATRRTNAEPAKLLTVESDVGVVYNVVRSSVRPVRKPK
jgi:hypothetical protein